MTHEDAGHYAAKHPQGTTPEPAIVEAVKTSAREGKISCAAAHRIARHLNVSPSDVGKTVDLLEYRLVRCQLGLYGYEPEKRIVQPADSVDPKLAHDIRAARVNDRLPCAAGWVIAENNRIPKMAVASACETLKIKIKPCQLGAF